MKYLFIVQGEGRGHLTQSLALRKMLVAHGHEVVAVMVGRSKQRSIPGFYTDNIQSEVLGFKSPNFLPSNQFKHIPFIFSLLYNLFYLPQYFDSMLFIRRAIKEHQPDVVVNFYELLCGLTYGIFRPSVPMVSVGHQYFFLTDEFRYEGSDKAGFFMLNFFSRLTAWNSSKKLALSFHPVKNGTYTAVRFVPPLLREEVLSITPQNGNYIHGYLLNSIYAEELKEWSRQHPDEELHFFWDKRNVNDTERLARRLYMHTLDDKLFLYFMAQSKGYATTAGFESVCEALYLGKPVLMIPTHIEQECNAMDATRAGAGISSANFDLSRLLAAIPNYQPSTAFREWVMRAEYDFLAELTEVECVRGWAFI